MTRIKILHLITGLERGGAQTVLLQLARTMDRARFAHVVVSLMDEGRCGADLRQAGARVEALGLRRGWPSPAALVRLARVVRAERPDILLSWLYHADLFSLFAKLFAPGAALAWNLRCTDVELGHYPFHVRIVLRLLVRASGLPDIVIANSEAGRRFHERLGYRAKRWAIMPNGFDLDRFRPDAAARAALRRRLGIGDGQPVVGMVARVDPMKDHASFLAAAEQVAQSCGDAAFVLAGAGTERLRTPPALAGRLHALGETDAVETILPCFDLLVLPSAFGEGLPNVVGEAMACGVPCVVTDVGDAAALVGDSGVVVPPRDPSALAAAILRVLGGGHAALACRGAAARRRIAERYALAAAVARYEELCAELAIRRPTAHQKGG